MKNKKTRFFKNVEIILIIPLFIIVIIFLSIYSYVIYKKYMLDNIDTSFLNYNVKEELINAWYDLFNNNLYRAELVDGKIDYYDFNNNIFIPW
jgi:uncharacterized membrane protein SpoIIM required for sporulation